MESGEKEMRKVFEETTTRNVMANVEFSNDTRKLVRELQENIDSTNNNFQALTEKVKQLQSQITYLQTIMFRGGTV